MRSAKSVGRAVGLALLMPIPLSPPVYFVWLGPITTSAYLATASGSAMQIRLSALLLFVLGSMTLTAAILAWPLFRRYSERMAMAFIVMGVLILVTIAMEALAIRNMLAVSVEAAKVGTPNELLKTVGQFALSTRHAAHFTNLMVAHATMFFLYVILYRFAFVPRALAAAGLATSLLSTTAVTMPLLGYPLNFQLIVPMGLVSVALTLWLIVRGFAEGNPPRADYRVIGTGASA